MGQENFVIALDDILQKLGPFGKYNIVNYALLLFPIYLAGMYGQVFVFEALDIDYKCKISECENGNNLTWLSSAIPAENDEFSRCYKHAFRKNITIANGSCTVDDFDTKVIETCDSYDYGDQDSAVKDFDLGCQNWKRTLIGTIHNAGLFISLPVTGIISDKYGRKVALSVASLMNGIFGFLRSFSVNYVMLVVLEFLEAALGAGAYSTAFVLAMELVGPKGRVFGNTIINAVYVMGLMTLSGLSWWLEDWRQLLRIIYTPAMLVFSYLWILNESVRWLLSKGRNDEAIAILNKAAKMNKVDISDDAVLTTPLKSVEKDTEVKVEVPEKEDTAKEPSNFVKVFKSSIIRNRVFVCSFLWITCTFVYYGLSINSVSLVGNKYVNFILVVFVEIPANFACFFLLDRYGRKRPLIIMYILSACLCVSLSFIPKGAKWLSLVLYLSGKFSITVAYSCVYIYVSEVFPTSVRQSMLAVCSSLGRVGSTLAPLTPLLAIHYYKNLPVIIFGSLALTASILVFTLPETINVPLPNTVEEAEMLSKKKKHSELE